VVVSTKTTLFWLIGWAFAVPAETSARLLPLEPFFAEAPRFHECLSPSGRWISYLGPDDQNINQLWAVNAKSPDHPVRISTSESGAVTACFWISGDRMVWQTQGADGRPSFFTGSLHPGSARKIPLDQKSIASLAGVAGMEDPASLVLGLSKEPTPYPDLHKLPLDGGDAVRVLTNHQRVFMWSLDGSGTPVVGLRWTSGGAKEVVDLRNAVGRVVFHAPAGDDLRLVSASADGRHAWILTNKDSNLTRLEGIHLETGSSQPIASDPLGRVDVENVVCDPLSSEPLAVCYSDETTRWQSLDPAFEEVLQRLSEDSPGDELISAGFSQDRKRWLLSLRQGGNPATVCIYDAETRRLRPLWNERPDLDPSSLCETKPIHYPARDGTDIPGFLTLPRSGKAPWPMVVFPHGGPNMRTTAGFDGRVQFLASRGYAVLQPNFRGSRGYGKAFMNAGDGQWGLGVMQSDLTDGVIEMIRKGVAAKGRVAIFGGSYGGYAALAGLTFTPDVYAAGISLFGMSDLNAYVSQVPTEWEPYAGDLVRRLGDPSTETGRADLTARSPLHHAAAVTAPLLIYHGMKDPLVPFSHASDMVTALGNAAKPVTFLAAPDEAHGFSHPESEMAIYRAIEIFLHEHIGGMVGLAPSESVTSRLTAFRKSGHSIAETFKH
jgi:dipeptidyl aminopeptidase/acylaminoacyl peptidase